MARSRIDLGNTQLQMGARLKKVASLLLLVFLASSLVSPDHAVAAKKPNPKSKISPSPSPKWPPAGFTFDAGVYARVPSSKQLVSLISAKRVLASQVKSCRKFVCSAVQVAAFSTVDFAVISAPVINALNADQFAAHREARILPQYPATPLPR